MTAPHTNPRWVLAGSWKSCPGEGRESTIVGSAGRGPGNVLAAELLTALDFLRCRARGALITEIEDVDATFLPD